MTEAEIKERQKELFLAKINESMEVGNVESGPFAQAYHNQRNQWLTEEKARLFDKKETKAESELVTAFNETQWKATRGQALTRVSAAYDGKPAAELNTDGLFNDVATGAMTGLMSGNVTGGLWFSIKHSLFNFIKNIPWVGNKIGQLKTYVQAMVSDKKLGWSESGEVYQRNQIKNRLTENIGFADQDALRKMLDQAADDAKKPVPVTVNSVNPVSDPKAPPGMIVSPAPPTPGTPGTAAAQSPPRR